MVHILCEMASQKILSATRGPQDASQGQIVFTVADMPGDINTLRWNGDEASPDLRPATAQELSDDLDSEKTSKADLSDDVLKAFALTVLDELNTLRAFHSLQNLTAADLRNAIKSKL